MLGQHFVHQSFSRRFFDVRLNQASVPSFYAQLKEQDLVSDDAIFVDGTKIKSDANKYSFIWRKATEKNEDKLDQKASDLYDEMIQAGVDTSIKAEEGLSTRRLQQLTTDLEHQISDLDEEVSQEKNAAAWRSS